MNQKEMVEICKNYGYNFSVPLIYRHGIKEGFLVKTNNEGREKYTVIESKFIEWLNKGKVSDEWISLGDAEREFGVSFSGIKYHLKKQGKEIKKLGIGGSRLFYAKRADVKQIVSEYTHGPKKERKNGKGC